MKKQKKIYLYDVKTESNTLLAPREVECIIYILRGKTSKQIARILELSHRTVEFYIGRLKDKLDCHTKSELIEKILSGRLSDQGITNPVEAMVVREHQKIDGIINLLEHTEQDR